MNPSHFKLYGGPEALTPEERFLEIRDIFVAALRRMNVANKSLQTADNKLDKAQNESVYASID